MKKPRICIVMEGGVVQSVVTDDPNLVNSPILVIEYEKDEESILIPQDDGSEEEATVGCHRAEEVETSWLAFIWKALCQKTEKERTGG